MPEIEVRYLVPEFHYCCIPFIRYLRQTLLNNLKEIHDQNVLPIEKEMIILRQ